MRNIYVNAEANKVFVTYAIETDVSCITHAEYALVLSLADRKVAAIKFLRDQHGYGLLKAKRIADEIWANT